MKKLTAILLMCFNLNGICQEIPVAKKYPSENIIQIDLYNAWQNAKVYPLSTVAESVEYLPLETTEECLIGPIISEVIATSKEIIVCVYEDKCYRFNRRGEFLNSIGSVGRGPKEVTKTRSAVIDTINRWIYIVDWEKLVKYDFKGNFLAKYRPGGTLDLKGLMLKPELVLLSGNRYQYEPSGNRFSFRFFSEKRKNYISKVACEKKDKIPFCICTPSMYKFNNETYLSDFWSDTIYRVKNPHNLEAYAVLNKGKFEYRKSEDKSILGGKNTGEERVLEKRRMAENTRFIFIETNKGTFIYDKNKKDTYCSDYIKFENRWANFNNDITSVPFRLLLNSPNSINNNILLSYINAYEFFEDGVDISNKKIIELMQKIEPDDNPVLILVKLKN